jgi:hypothetical protein
MDNFNFYIEPKITKDFLLSYNKEETYMSFYLGIPIKKGLFCSPLRKDNTPTCSFYRNKNGDLIFKDFNGSFYGNFISVVMYKYGLQYNDALRTIANDFNLIKTPGYVKHQGVVVANHLWITDAKLFFEMNIKENTKIQFKAAVYEYVKGYLGKKPVLGKRLLKVDYTLIYISDIKIIE